MRSAHLALALVAAFVSSALLTSSAEAEFGPIELVSKSPREQAKFAVEPAMSVDGRFVAFCGAIGGREGIFREQLETDQVVPVVFQAEGNAFNCKNAYASAPSISADGRFISFVTKAALDPTDDETAGSSDVYLADMAGPSPTYELASAADGSDVAMNGGSIAAGRVALSADGRRVVFVNEGNVYVRELGTGRTILISARRNLLTGETEEGEAVPEGGAYEPAGAAISADGSTVAWVGEHLSEEVPLLSDEEAEIRSIESRPRETRSYQYHEPLWRRVPDGETPPTRRVVGGGDPLAPGCPPSGTLADPACQGPFPNLAKGREFTFVEESQGVGWGLNLPQLSSDGETVAVIGNPDEDVDLFVVEMSPGLDRREAVRRLTRWTNPAPLIQNPTTIFEQPRYWPFTGAVKECAISSDGDWIAFTTTRQNFSLVPPTLLSPRPAAISLNPELYQVDLRGGTIERATPAPGQDVSLTGGAEGIGVGATSPSYGAGGRLLAFASDAYNLVTGDANEGNDTFLVETFPPAPIGASKISSIPPPFEPKAQWRLSARAFSLPDGGIRVVAVVPGVGKLRARAKAQVGGRLKMRRVAGDGRRAKSAGTLSLELDLPHRLRLLSRRKGGLAAAVSVSFGGSAGPPLHALLQARFRAHHKNRHGHDKGGTR